MAVAPITNTTGIVMLTLIAVDIIGTIDKTARPVHRHSR